MEVKVKLELHNRSLIVNILTTRIIFIIYCPPSQKQNVFMNSCGKPIFLYAGFLYLFLLHVIYFFFCKNLYTYKPYTQLKSTLTLRKKNANLIDSLRYKQCDIASYASGIKPSSVSVSVWNVKLNAPVHLQFFICWIYTIYILSIYILREL